MVGAVLHRRPGSVARRVNATGRLWPAPKWVSGRDGGDPPADLPPQGYRIDVRHGAWNTTADDDAGEAHAQATCFQLQWLQPDGPNDVTIVDWPDTADRGIGLRVGEQGAPAVDAVADLVATLGSLKMNRLAVDRAAFTSGELDEIRAACDDAYLDLDLDGSTATLAQWVAGDGALSWSQNWPDVVRAAGTAWSGDTATDDALAGPIDDFVFGDVARRIGRLLIDLRHGALTIEELGVMRGSLDDCRPTSDDADLVIVELAAVIDRRLWLAGAGAQPDAQFFNR